MILCNEFIIHALCMTCIKFMEMSMMMCSFVTIVLCIGNIYYVLNFLYMCTCIYWIVYWYTIFSIVCVVHWFTLNCCVIWLKLVNFLYIAYFLYLGLYCTCIFCGVHWINWYLAVLGIHVHGHVLFVLKIGLLSFVWLHHTCILGITVFFVYYVLWLHLAVYRCIFFCVTYLLIRWWIWCWNIPLPKSFIKICIWYLIIQSSKQSWAILIQKYWIALLCSRYLAYIITLNWKKKLSLSLSGKQNKFFLSLTIFFSQYNVAARQVFYMIWKGE